MRLLDRVRDLAALLGLDLAVVLQKGVQVAGILALALRVVMLRDAHGVLHVIPNGAIGMVSNRTRGFSRAVIDVGVAYQESVDRALTVSRDVVHEFWQDPQWHPQLVEEPAVLGVDALADTAVVIRLQTTTLPGRQFEIGRELRRRVKNRLDQEGISIPHPQRTIHVADGGVRRGAAERV